MSSDRDTDRSPSDSARDDEVYAQNEAGELGVTRQSGDNEGIYQGYPHDVHPIVDPNVYGPILLVGAILLLFPEPVTSMLGLVLLLTGAFLGLTDVLAGPNS